jgi:hypothetical protein
MTLTSSNRTSMKAIGRGVVVVQSGTNSVALNSLTWVPGGAVSKYS